MDQTSQSAQDAKCLRAVANALTIDPGLIGFLRELAPQWGSSTGKTRSYSGLKPSLDDRLCCVLRIDSRAAIMLNDALYSSEGPSPRASRLAHALRNPEIAESGKSCVIHSEGIPPILVHIEQYADENGNAVAPQSPAFHHRVVSIVPR